MSAVNFRSCLLPSILIVAVLVGPSLVSADPITVKYQAEIITVTGPVFGITPTTGTMVNGSFTYETLTPDSNADPTRGDYKHAFGGAFDANIVGFGTTVTGSATPFVQVENFGTFDSFRYIDGSDVFNQVDPDGVMLVNGAPDPNARLSITISDLVSNPFSDDALPNPFPWTTPPASVTFILGDGPTNQIQMVVNSFAQVPEPGTGSVCWILATGLFLRRNRRRG